MIYDELNHRLILSGVVKSGFSEDTTGDTWAFDIGRRRWNLLSATLSRPTPGGLIGAFNTYEAPLNLFYHRGVQRPILIGALDTFVLNPSTGQWDAFAKTPAGRYDIGRQNFGSGASYNDQDGLAYYFESASGAWGVLNLTNNDLLVAPEEGVKIDLWKVQQLKQNYPDWPSKRTFFALYYDYDLRAMVLTPGKQTNNDGTFTPQTGTYQMNLNTLLWQPVRGDFQVAANVYSVQQGPYRSKYFNSTFMLVVTYGSTSYLSVLQRVNNGICFTPYQGSALSALQIAGFLSMGVAAVLWFVSLVGMSIIAAYMQKQASAEVQRDFMYNLLLDDAMTKFMMLYNVFIMSLFYILMTVPSYFVFGSTFPDFWVSTTKASCHYNSNQIDLFPSIDNMD
jgi:hypothetical protein